MPEPLMWMIVEMAFAMITTVVMFFFARAFLKDERELHTGWKALVFTSVFFTRFLSNYFFSDSVMVVSGASLAIASLIGMICFRAKVYVVLLSAVFYLLVSASTELISAFIITTFQPVAIADLMQHGVYRLQARTVNYLLLLVLVMLITRFRRGRMNIFKFKTAMTHLILPLVSMFVAYRYAIHVTEYGHTLTISDVFTLFSIIFVNVIIFILTENLIRQNEKDRMFILLKSQDEIKNSHIVQLTENQKQARKMSHDFKQYIDMLIALCTSNKHEELLKNLNELSAKTFSSMSVDSGNIMLDAILYSKKEEAKKHNIDFKLELDVLKEHPGISMDICTMLGNGLDNAIEACIRSENIERFVQVRITANVSQFECYIKNSIGEKPIPDGKFFKSSKPDAAHHGIGLRSMKQTCDAFGGIIDYGHDDKYFECHIYLPLK